MIGLLAETVGRHACHKYLRIKKLSRQHPPEPAGVCRVGMMYVMPRVAMSSDDEPVGGRRQCGAEVRATCRSQAATSQSRRLIRDRLVADLAQSLIPDFLTPIRRGRTLATQAPQSRRRPARVQPASPADAGGIAEGHRRPGRGDRADLRRHLHPRPLPAGRRARAGQDADGQHAGADPRHPVQADPVHARPDAVGHHGHERVGGRRARAGGTSASSRGRSSPTSCWPTKSTARRPRRRPRCCRRCRSAR